MSKPSKPSGDVALGCLLSPLDPIVHLAILGMCADNCLAAMGLEK